MRTISRLTLTLLLLVLAAACADDGSAGTAQATPTTTTTVAGDPVLSRPPLHAADVIEVATRLSDAVNGHRDAWMAQDPDLIRAHWGPGTIHEDTGFGVEISGDELMAMADDFTTTYTDYRSVGVAVLVSSGVALDLSHGWGVHLKGYTFTENSPMIEVDRVEVLEDGILGRWTLFYSLDTYELWNANPTRMAIARNLLDSWLAAWQSGDPDLVVALYAPNAVRIDSLWGAEANGAAEISAQAADFFGWYPGVTLAERTGFSDNRRSFHNPERVGMVYDIEVTQQGGSACTVTSAVLLTVLDGSIVHEELFWDADSLIACGWAE